MNPKQQARLGLFHLEEAILDVLSVEEPLEPSPISTRIGIRSLTDASSTLAYAIVHGVLVKLKEEGRVDRVGNNQGWKLTERQRNERNGMQ
jgi:hypothetical protein